jgi:hypothetical protein
MPSAKSMAAKSMAQVNGDVADPVTKLTIGNQEAEHDGYHGR